MHGRILIVDAVATNRVALRALLADAFYDPLVATDGAGCLRVLRSERPDAILIDMDLPDGPAEQVLEALRGEPSARTLPVVALTGSADPGRRLAALAAGADDVLPRPLAPQLVLSRLRSLMRGRADAGLVVQAWGDHAPGLPGFAEPAAGFQRPGRCAIVSGRQGPVPGCAAELGRLMGDRLCRLNRDQTLALPPVRDAATPEIFIIPADLDGEQGGLRLMTTLKGHAGTRHSAICVMTAGKSPDVAAMAYDLGADEVIADDTPAAEMDLRLNGLLARKRRNDRTRDALESGFRLSLIDDLTGVHNRRYGESRLAGFAAQADQAETTFAVLIVDIDRFKSVNDRFGHAAGDTALIEVARRLSANMRMDDVLARLGGEEFLVALPQTGADEARRLAERLRQVVGGQPVLLDDGSSLTVTVSIGVAVGPLSAAEGYKAVMERADRALMRSKSAGRNLVTFSESLA